MSDSTDYPLFLFNWEYEALVNRKKRLHIHDWQPRRATRPDQLGIMSGAPTIEYTQFPSGRFCRKCGYIDFVLTMRKARRKASRWTQTDLSYLLSISTCPMPVSDDSEPLENK